MPNRRCELGCPSAAIHSLHPVASVPSKEIYPDDDGRVDEALFASLKAGAVEIRPGLGETRMGGTPARVREIIERIDAAMAATSQ